MSDIIPNDVRASATEIDVTVTVSRRAQGNSKSYVPSLYKKGNSTARSAARKAMYLHVQEGKQHRAKRGQKSSVQEGRQRRAKRGRKSSVLVLDLVHKKGDSNGTRNDQKMRMFYR